MPPPNPKENVIYFSSDWRMSAVIVKDVLIETEGCIETEDG